MLDWTVRLDEPLLESVAERATTRPGRVQLLHGPPGIGKTTTAAGVARHIESLGFTVVPIVGIRELTEVPLAAIGPVLALAARDAEVAVGERIQHLFSTFAARDARYVLVIDDGPMLDEVSASIVYQLVRVLGVRCVMTACDEQRLAAPIRRLEKDGLVERTLIHGLDLDDIRAALEAGLGGPIEPDSLKRLAKFTSGNPLYLRELLLAAQRQGDVHPSPAGFVVDTGHLPRGIVAATSARIASLSEPERRLAELIAIAQPWPEDRLDDPEALRGLDRRSLIARPEPGLVQIAQPFFAEILIAELSPDALTALRLEAASRLADTLGADHRFAIACLLAETPQPPDPLELVWASVRASELGDHALALTLATAALRPGPLAPALLASAVALSALGRSDDAESAFLASAEASDSDSQRAEVAARHGEHLAFRMHSAREAIARGEAARAALEDRGAVAMLDAAISRWRLLVGDPLTVATRPAGTMGEAAYRALLLVLGGELSAFRAEIANARSLPAAPDDSFSYGSAVLEFSEFLLMVFEGRLDDAVAMAREHQRNPFDDLAGLWTYGLTLIALHAGRASQAEELGALAVQQLRWRDPAGSLGSAMGLLASAAAQMGHQQLVDDTIAELPPGLEELQSAEATAWTLASGGRAEAAIEALIPAVRRGIELGQYARTALALHVAVRLGGAGQLSGETEQIASAAQGELVAVICAHARAAASLDPAALLAVAPRLAATGSLAGAESAATLAAELFASTKKPENERKATLLAKSWAASLSGWRPGVRTALAFDLSDREHDIAVAAARRESSREIAERLGISVRTVDNHLTNIYRKLGVSSRAELREVLAADA